MNEGRKKKKGKEKKEIGRSGGFPGQRSMLESSSRAVCLCKPVQLSRNRRGVDREIGIFFFRIVVFPKYPEIKTEL